MNITVRSLKISDDDYAKFELNVLREMNFTKSPAAYPIEVEGVVEWECMVELLKEFYQNDYAYQLNNNQHDDDNYFNYPPWFDGESWHESRNIDEWIEHGNIKDFARQFIEQHINTVLLETQYDFKAEMKIVNRSKKAA